MSQALYIEPLDILFLRNNHLFGAAAGDSAQAQMPPWPSVFAGAIRSRMLADAGVSIAALKSGALPAPLDTILGTPEHPGEFTLGSVVLRHKPAGGQWDTYHPLPADLVIAGSQDAPVIHRLQPQQLPATMATSNASPQLPILRRNEQAKPVAGFWLNRAGWQAHLRGKLPNAKHLKHQSALWQTENRLGIALDEAKRSAADGQIYTSDAVAMRSDTGFHVTVHGADDQLPQSGLLRLGGDGRGAHITALPAQQPPQPDWDAIQKTGRFRLILTSPGIFADGHRPTGTNKNGHWNHTGLSAQLISQAVPRFEVVSGWDMANHAPKPAQRCAPTGAVYWFDGFDGDIDALRKLSATGLWDDTTHNSHASRRAEGFNCIAIANVKANA